MKLDNLYMNTNSGKDRSYGSKEAVYVKKLLWAIYRSPRTLREQTKQFINEFTSLVHDLDNSHFNIVLAGNYNLQLLKINENEICCEFFDLLTSQSLFPHITLPTRLTNGGGTQIYNLFCKMNKSIKKHTAGILLNQLSDHLLYFTLLETDTAHNSKNKFTIIFKQNDDVIQQIQNEINSSELHKKLDTSQTANPNASYNVIMNVIETASKKHMTGNFFINLTNINIRNPNGLHMAY